jgi:hypothetical protein
MSRTNDPNAQQDSSRQSPLFGRDRDLETLQRAIEGARTGSGRLALISGEAGIGKTTLVRAACGFARALDIRVQISTCYEHAGQPPYQPWFELVDALGHAISPKPATHVSELTGKQDPLPGTILDSFRAASAQQPLLLVLDDLHWADAATVEVLRFVGRQLDDIPILIVATYRDTDVDRDHPLYALLPNIVRESDSIRIALRSLGSSDIEEMLEHRYQLKSSSRNRLASYLLDRTEGNPFFIEEVLRSLEEDETIIEQDDGWELGDLRITAVPALVQQVIDRRLAHIHADYRRMLAIASVIGQDVPLDLWQQIGSLSDEELSGASDAALKLNILEESALPSTVRFTHSLIREALYHDIRVPQRRHLHRSVAEISAERGQQDPDFIAWHYQQAGHERAVEWLMLAGERAQTLYAWRTAAERFSTVWNLIAHDRSRIRARAWLAYRIGRLLTYAEPEQSILWMQDAELLATDSGDDQLVAWARADRGLLRCLTGDVRRGLGELRSGVEAIDDLAVVAEPDESDDSLAISSIRRGIFNNESTENGINERRGPLILWLAWAGLFTEAVEIGTRFIHEANAAGVDLNDALGDALAGVGHARAALGQPDDALNAFEQARQTYGAIDHHFKVGNTAIYELSEAYLPFRAERIIERQWLADQAEAY